MTWWIWMLAGLAMLLVELATPGGFYFLFFGSAALLVGCLQGLGVGPDWVLWLIFSVGSVGSLLLFRSPLVRMMNARQGTTRPVDSLVGAQVVLTEELAPHGLGKGELRGSVWNVENAGDTVLSRGQRCRVARVEGLKLVVQAE